MPTTSTSEHQEPLVPAEVDFRSFTFVSFDIAWLTEGEDIAYQPDAEFKAAITLHAKAWGQHPAASLPDDAQVLAYLAGFGRGPNAVSEWNKVKDGALAGFALCSDGRWYSKHLAPKAIKAWKDKQDQKAKTVAATEARAAKRKAAAEAPNVTDNVTSNVTKLVTSTKEDKIRGEESRGRWRARATPVAVGVGGKGGVGEVADYEDPPF